jgi:hypothetical protein
VIGIIDVESWKANFFASDKIALILSIAKDLGELEMGVE